MPTDVISSIGSAGGRDYATLALWEAACPANLVTDDKRWIGECYNDSEFTAAGNILTIAGMTTDSTRYVILRCGTGQSFKDNASIRSTALAYNASNGVAIRMTGTSANLLSVTAQYTRVQGLQLSATGGSAVALYGESSSGIIYVDDCIAVGGDTVFSNIHGETKNTLVYGSGTSGWLISLNRTGCKILGCTLVSTATRAEAIRKGYGATGAVIQNTAIFGCTAAFSDSSGYTISYLGTDIASPPGTNNQTGLTTADQFENSATDFRAKSTGSLDLNGTPDSTNIPNDISGTTRHASTPTIGAWEVVASSTVIPVFMNQYRQRWN